MAQQAPAKSNLQSSNVQSSNMQSSNAQSNDQLQRKTPEVRQVYGPLGLSPREFFSMGPFSLMKRMAEEMDRAWVSPAASGEAQALWSPSIEVLQHNGDIAIRADLPGLKPDEVKVEVIDGALVVEGERKFEDRENQRGVYRTERLYGRFYRSIPLPEGAKTDQARAKFENGVLEVTVPVTEQSSDRRQIPIEATTTAAAPKNGPANA